FHTPQFYGSAFYDHRHWILIEHIPGPDLRDFTDTLAYAAANSITEIMNAYWQSDVPDGRFELYWERINKRARCLTEEPVLRRAYDRFLERQQSCPRTLCSGDFLQFNAIDNGGKVYIIDWAFAGIMPYSLDIARMIAHGTGDRRTFPFYMTDRHKSLYVRRVYDLLVQKPDREQYLQDVRLSVLNEYIEFIEWDLNHPGEERDQVFDYYYTQAQALAAEING
ncbi:MAG: aminoglycoside phosphotransferase family protein, partial [Oscillospiraceae bacterium]|nr:aminoglycoside phosphotransferase family protein [Oscillospiraceae bacterium]